MCTYKISQSISAPRSEALIGNPRSFCNMVQSFLLETLWRQFRAVTARPSRKTEEQAAKTAEYHTRHTQHGENAKIHTTRLCRSGWPVTNGARQQQTRRQTHGGDQRNHYQLRSTTKDVHGSISSPSNS